MAIEPIMATEPQRNPGWRVHSLSLPRLIRSEWVKLFTVGSTWVLLSVTLVLNVGIAVLMAYLFRSNDSAFGPNMAGAQGLWSERVAEGSTFTGMILLPILAVLTITSEYSSGLIRATFAVAPRRVRVMLAKMVVVALVVAIVSALSVAIGWAAGYAILQNTPSIDLALTTNTSLRVLGGYVVEMVLLALFSFGLGAWVKWTAAGVGTALGMILVLPGALAVLSLLAAPDTATSGWRKWLVDANQFLPTNAGNAVTTAVPPPDALYGPWEGVGILGIWALAALVIGVLVTARRDV